MDASYNNVGGINDGVFSSSVDKNGDIVLAQENTNKNKMKKWIIIFVIVFCAIIIGLFIWLVINNVSFTGPSSDGVRKDFNKFANYVINGEEQEAEIDPKFDLLKNYYFSNENLAREEKEAIYTKTDELFSYFWDQYNKLSDDEKRMIISDLDEFSTWGNNAIRLLDFIVVVYKKDLITDEYLFNIYKSEGENAVGRINGEYYELSNLKGNEIADDFSEGLDGWISLNLDRVKILRDNNCLGETITESDFCISNSGNEVLAGEYQKIIDASRIIYNRDLKSNYNRLDNFILYVYILNALINGGDVSDYVRA